MGRVIPAFTQMFDGEGDPLAYGWLRFLVSGSNNTDKDTYNDSQYQIPNANPLQLDAEGRCPSVFGVGDYRVISFVNDPDEEESPGEQIQLFDPVAAQGAVEGSGGSGSVFDQWDPTVPYEIGSIVEKDLIYYRSLANSNLGFDPALEDAFWEVIEFLVLWNSTVTYEVGDLVYHIDNLYLSLQDSNNNNSPTTSPSYWRAVATGSKGTITQSSSYSITSTDRDSLVVLTPAAVADATFDLPAMDASLDRFTLWIYNASDYVLELDAAGSAGIWLNTSGTLDITGGSLTQLMYNAYLDCWISEGNVGPTLGNQDIGTASFPVLTAHITSIQATDFFVTNATVDDLIVNVAAHVQSDTPLYFGDADEAVMMWDTLSTSLIFDVPLTAGYRFRVGSVDQWIMETTGELVPGALNSNPDIGSATDSVAFVYATNISLPDLGYAYFGNDDDLIIYSDGANSYIDAFSDLYIRTIADNSISFVQNSVLAGAFDLSGNFIAYNYVILYNLNDRLVFGSPANLEMRHSGSNGVINNVTGVMYFQSNGTNAFFYVDNDVYFSDDTVVSTNNYAWFGALNTGGYIRYTTNYLRLGTSSSTYNISIEPAGTAKWIFDGGGAFYPYANNAYDIGTSTNIINDVYTNRLRLNQINTYSTSLLFLLGGLATSRTFEVVDHYETEVITGFYQYTIKIRSLYASGLTFTFVSETAP